MSDQGNSGNRWEPGDEPADRPAPGTVAQRAAAGRLRVSRTQAGLAGAGALLLVGGGLGGFFIGHATAGDGHDGRDLPGAGRPDFGNRTGRGDGDDRGQLPPAGPGQGSAVPGGGTDQD